MTAAGFSDGEYVRRQAAVRDALATTGCDAIAATSKLSVQYLTGTWGSQYWVAPLIVTDAPEATFVVREFEADRVRQQGHVGRIRTYLDRTDAVERWAETLTELGLGRSRLGLELDNTDLTHRDVTRLQELLPGLRVTDVSPVIPRVMATKSDEELRAMRRSMEYTTVAVRAFEGALREGVTEAETRREMELAVRTAGSDGLRGGVAFGRHSAVPHGRDQQVVLRTGDVAVTETSGYHLGYCAALCRTAVVGRNPEASALHAHARAALEAAMAAMAPGVSAGAVDREARRVLADRGVAADTFRHRTGYSNGLQANGRLNLSLQPEATDELAENMTFHLPIILFQRGRFSVACSESVVVTRHGAEPLGQHPRDLVLVPG